MRPVRWRRRRRSTAPCVYFFSVRSPPTFSGVDQ
nr:MAG TPA: hypothetical protein [Caudoviricetes sp.]